MLPADGMVPHEEVILTVGRMMPDKNDDTTLVSGEKRKHKDTG